ncbi:MAG: hypothetical protein IKJ26_02270 [Clostridia bacterium]|nr:hypothetical protein [Clostridia bacterium]
MKPITTGDRFCISNGELKAELLTPWSSDYQRTRFAHAAFISGLWLGDVCLTQAERAQAGQTSTGGVGLCCEYKCPQIEMDSAVGEEYLKVGVGVLTRTQQPWTIVDDQRITGLPTTVLCGDDTAVFECVSPTVNGYAYREKRTVKLLGRVIRLECELENTGEKPIEISEYCHNFVSLGGLATDETHHLDLLCAQMLPSAADCFVPTPTGAGWTKAAEGSFSAPCEVKAFDGPCAWKLRSDRTPLALSEWIDFEPSTVYVWGTPYCVCAEVYKAISIQPGQTARWSREWHVTCDERNFINYAHRGASEYAPENTLLSFYTGLFMGANGIETDVQMTKDGVLVLFHDDTILRLTGAEGSVPDYTLDELRQFTFEKNGLKDKIVVFEDFLQQFAWRDLTLAIEIKQRGIERQIVDMIRKYNARCVVTSFMFDCIEKVRACAPELKVGWLKKEITPQDEQELLRIGGEEICPFAPALTAQDVDRWHRMGFNVRAWGVRDEKVMRHACACGVDGMTVNFPDKLTQYLKEA